MNKQHNNQNMIQEVEHLYTSNQPNSQFLDQLERQLMREALNQSQTTKKQSWFSLNWLFNEGMKTAVSLTILTLIVGAGIWIVGQNSLSDTSLLDGAAIEYLALRKPQAGEMTLEMILLTEEESIYELGENVTAFAVSPDRDYLAYSQALEANNPETEEVFVMQLDTQEVQQITDNPITDSVAEWSWSPNGRYLLFSSYPSDSPRIVKIWDSVTGEIETIEDPYHESSAPIWGFDNNSLLFTQETESGSKQYQLFQYDFETGDQEILLNDVANGYLQWSDDYSKLVVRSGDYSQLLLLQADGSQIVLVDNIPSPPLNQFGTMILWAPDNETMSYEVKTAEDHFVYLLHADSGSQELLIDIRRDFPQFNGTFRVADWSLDGNHLLVVTGDEGYTSLEEHLFSLETGELTPLNSEFIRVQIIR